ncbi:Ms4533A family Cys-rich leader peptide [Rhodococcus sp. (in: high G+C Gram-positive bacteria)]
MSVTSLPRVRHELALFAIGSLTVADVDCCR